jgi:hypothetical protein
MLQPERGAGGDMIRHSDCRFWAPRPSELRDLVEHRCSAFDDEARIAKGFLHESRRQAFGLRIVEY